MTLPLDRFSCRNLRVWLALAALSIVAHGQTGQHATPSRLGVHPNTFSTTTIPNSTQIGRAGETAPTITFGRIDFPRSPSGIAYGLNGRGDVVGVYGPISPIGYFASFGYVLKGNTFHDFNYPDAVASGPLSINNRRQIVGYYDPTGNYEFHAFLYKGAKFTNIDYPGSEGGAAYCINDSGVITGIYYDANSQHGFILEKGIYTTIDPPGSVITEALGSNSSGTVVGDYYDSNQQLHGFIYQNGQYTTVDYPGAPDTILSGINDQGQIVGGYGADKSAGAYDWRTPNMFLLSQGQFTPLILPVDNAQITIPYAFKGDSLVGFYVDSLANLYGYHIKLGGTHASRQSRRTK